MADKHIGALTEATSLDDDSMLVAEQQGSAVKVPGSLFKKFAREGVESYVTAAQEAAESAMEAVAEAEAGIKDISDSVSKAESAATAAETAQGKAESASSTAQTAASNASSAKTAAETAEKNAKSAQTAAETAKTTAQTAATNASTAQGKAETAQKAAESAKTSAETASTTATTKASEAASSATTAQQYSGKPPIIQNGTWWTWDAANQKYVDTGSKAQGEKGDKGDTGDKGKDGDGSGDMTTATYDPQGKRTDIYQYVDDAVENGATIPTVTVINLKSSGWSNSTQTVSVTDVSADETAQLIQTTPAIANMTAWYDAGVYCSGQSAGKLTFTTSDTPTTDLTAYVVITELATVATAETTAF